MEEEILTENVGFFWKVLIATCAGIFGIAIALSVQHIRLLGMPKWLIITASFVQLILSWGVFIFVLLLFKSSLLPQGFPTDDWTALTIAYFCSAVPHIVITTALIIYAKEINKFLEKRYGDGTTLPNMNQIQRIVGGKKKIVLGDDKNMQCSLDEKDEKDEKDEVAAGDVRSEYVDKPQNEEKSTICPNCNKEIKNEIC